MEADLYDKGDSMEYDVTIENKGTLDVKLNDILTNVEKENNDAVLITFTGYTKGEILKAGASKIVHVKIEYNPEYEGGETSSEVEINFDYVQNNNEENPSDNQYLLTYDYGANGGTEVNIETEYYGSGSNVNLENKAYKERWTFVGWNTDKDAEVGLEMNLKNTSKENIKLDDIDIIVKDSNREILRIKNEVDKTLKPNESIIVSTQTKANLSKDIHYYLNIEY